MAQLKELLVAGPARVLNDLYLSSFVLGNSSAVKSFGSGLAIDSNGVLSVSGAISGSGTSGYLAKWSSGSALTDGAQYDTAASNSTIAQRTGSGYLYATYFNHSNSAVNIASYTVRGVNFTSSDGFIRNTSKANFTSWLGLGEVAYLSGTTGNEGKYLCFDGSGEYSWGSPMSGYLPLTGGTLARSSASTSAVLTVNQTYATATTWINGIDIYAPSLSPNSSATYSNFAAIVFGRTAAAYMSGNLTFHYTSSSTPASNWISLGLHSHDHILNITGNERVGIKNTAPSYSLDVTGQIRATSGYIISGSTYAFKQIGTGLEIDSNGKLNCTLTPCLIEGTKILMADGSEKNIEDVVEGDLIKSYDPSTQQLCEAIVIANNETGRANDYVNYYFEDGSFLTIFGDHLLYSANEGTARINTAWEPGWTGINANGEPVTFIGTEDVSGVGHKRHYDLHSSNKLYYANGILNAQSLTSDYTRFFNPEWPESYKAALKEDYDISVAINQHKINRTVGAQMVPILKELKKQKRLLDENKKLLADSDYLVAKFTEGLISATEWIKAKASRASWR